MALVQPPAIQALDLQGGFHFKNILKKIFPPCGPGTKKERWIVTFVNGAVGIFPKGNTYRAWCVSGDQDAH